MEGACARAQGATVKDRGRRTAAKRRVNFITHLEGALSYFMCSRVMRRWRASHSSSGNCPFATERDFLYRSIACFVWCNLSCAVASKNNELAELANTVPRKVNACKVTAGSLLAEAAKAR